MKMEACAKVEKEENHIMFRKLCSSFFSSKYRILRKYA